MKKSTLIAMAVLLAAIVILMQIVFDRSVKYRKDMAEDMKEEYRNDLLAVTTVEHHCFEPIEEPTHLVIESPIPSEEPDPIEEVPEETEPVIETPLEEWEIILIARLTEAEAGGEPELGQRLVIDTVLNRMDHWAFPDTIEEVIYQPYHFSPVWSGGINCYTGREDLIQLVREEMIERADYDVIFFQAGGYSMYGVPMYQVGNHYFSSY